MLRRTLLLIFLLLPISLEAADKWKLTLATMDNCGPCRALKDSFESDPHLITLKKDFDFQIKNWDRRTDRDWFDKVGTPIRSFPKIVVQTPDGETTAILSRKQNEKNDKLAERIRDSVKAHESKHALLKGENESEVRFPLIRRIFGPIFSPIETVNTPIRNWLSCCSLFPFLLLTAGAVGVIMILVRTFLPNGVQKK